MKSTHNIYKKVKSCPKKDNKVSIYLLLHIKYKNVREVKNYLQRSMSVRLEHLGNYVVFIFDNTRQKPYSSPANPDILVNESPVY